MFTQKIPNFICSVANRFVTPGIDSTDRNGRRVCSNVISKQPKRKSGVYDVTMCNSVKYAKSRQENGLQEYWRYNNEPLVHTKF